MKKAGEFLKEKRQEKGMSLREAAKASGISHVHIRMIEEGKRSPSFDRMMSLLRTYLVDVNKFLIETGYVPSSVGSVNVYSLKTIPVISWELAARWAEINGTFPEAEAEEWIAGDVIGQHLFALRVRDDSMLTEFRAGDIIIVNPDMKPEHNDYVIATEKGETTFKRLKRYGNTVVLQPLNPKYEDTEISETNRHRIIGKVVKKEKRY